jgi:glycosyltransferase involved in cell wall biosynthesis
MKIIFLVLSFELGGSERRGIILARYFKRRGFDVELWGLSEPGILSKICDENAIPWKIFPFDWYQNPGKRLANLYNLFRVLKKAKPDVILSHTLIPNTVCGLVWRWTGAKKIIAYEGGHEFGLADRKWETLAARQIPQFVCNAQHLADEMMRFYNLDKDKIEIIPNGVELPEAVHTRTWWRSKLGVDADAFLAVMVANLSEFKDHETLIRAWRLVLDRSASRDRQIRLLLAGKNFGTEPRLKSLVNDLGMQENVQFLGQVQDIAGLLETVDIGVYSSRKEGVPNGVLECMWAGLAIVATDAKGIKEVLGEHQSAWLSPLDDAGRFADKILVLMEDMETRNRIGNRNRERVAKYYSPEKMCEKTERLVIGG